MISLFIVCIMCGYMVRRERLSYLDSKRKLKDYESKINKS